MDERWHKNIQNKFDPTEKQTPWTIPKKGKEKNLDTLVCNVIVLFGTFNKI